VGGDQPGADPDAVRAQHQRRRQPAPVRDPAGGQHQRRGHRVRDQRHQGEGRQGGEVVAAGLAALGHDHVHAVVDRLLRAVHRADLFEDAHPGRVQPVDPRPAGVPPVERHARRPGRADRVDLLRPGEPGDEVDVERAVGAGPDGGDRGGDRRCGHQADAE
jgi:hypothetical protein